MQPVKKGDKIRVHYHGKLKDGSTFDSSEGKAPLEFEVGSGQVIKGFDDAVLDMKAGDKKTVEIPVQDARRPYERSPSSWLNVVGLRRARRNAGEGRCMTSGGSPVALQLRRRHRATVVSGECGVASRTRQRPSNGRTRRLASLLADNHYDALVIVAVRPAPPQSAAARALRRQPAPSCGSQWSPPASCR